MERKKVLVVTYYWYPFAGVGTYRISRFVKYLAKSGWEVVILTTKNAAAGMREEPDDPVLKNCTVYRSNIIEPTGLLNKGKNKWGETSNPSIFYRNNLDWKSKLAVWVRLNLMIPDAKLTWKWFAVPLGKKVIEQENPDLILSTSPPPTTNLIAKKLAKWSGLPWIADFRDPWTNIYYYDEKPPAKLAQKLNKKLEASVLKAADRITLVNNGFFPEHQISEKSSVITNGYDSDQIVNNYKQESSKVIFTIRYFGSLKANQYPAAFINALHNINKNQDYNKGEILFEFFGNIDPDIRQELELLSPQIQLRFTDYIPHDEMMKLVKSADLLLLVIGKTKGSKLVLSTKVFEYMTSENPVLGIGPLDGSAAQVVEKTNIGKFFSHTDDSGIAEYILELKSAKKNGEKLFQPNRGEINKYDFAYLTQKLEKEMNSLLENEI